MQHTKNKSFILIIIIQLLFTINLSAQDIRRIFVNGEYHFLYDEFERAMSFYQRVLNLDTGNSHASYRIGQCITFSSPITERNKALPYFLKAAKNITPNFREGSHKERGAPKETHLYIANIYRLYYDFDKSIEHYNHFLNLLNVNESYYIDFVKREIEATNNAKFFTQFKVDLITENVDSIIGIDFDIGNCPLISYNKNAIIFTTNKKNLLAEEINIETPVVEDEDKNKIFFSVKRNNTWTNPRDITNDLGAKRITYPVSLNAKGNELYLVQNDRGDGNIYVSYYKSGQWSKMEKLNKNINSKHWESHASISHDGKSLYFTSDRPGGYGGLDIYVSHKDEKNDWGPALNIGPSINTRWDEEAPYLLDDNKTLYFSSQGHYSIGGFDIFQSSLIGPNSWSTPINLGYPINTVCNDLFYITKIRDEYAFFPLNTNDRNLTQADFFRVDTTILPMLASMITIKGNIELADGQEELPSDFYVAVIDSILGDTIMRIQPNFQTGEYAAIVPTGNYKIQYQGTGYNEQSKHLVIPSNFIQPEVVIDVEVNPKAVTDGEYYVVKNLFFDYDKYHLRRESKIELEKLANIMVNNPSLYIEVIGHTDSRGSSEYNKKLSEKRAKSAIDYLVEQKIDRSRFVAKGMGKESFIALNENPDNTDNPEGRQYNRRVEIKILNTDITNIIVENIEVPDHIKYSPEGRRRQFDTFTILVKKSDSKYNNRDNLTEHAINGNYLYSYGIFEERTKAIKELNNLIDKGYDDAEIITTSQLEKEKKLLADLNTKSTIASDSNTEFTIQIKALITPSPINQLTKLNNVKENYCKDGFYRYTYGTYKTKEEAIAECAKIIEAGGHPDAFVVSIEALNNRVFEESEYTIQLSSLNKPVNIGTFQGLKGVQERIGNDGKYKYVYGKFNSIEEARKELRKVQKSGYPDAFVIGINRFM